MVQIKLNKENPEIEFKLNSKDSSLLIRTVVIISPKNLKNEWTNFISSVKLITELNYIVFDDTHQRFIDEKKIQFPISLWIDSFQVQPIFQLNKLIRNQTFAIGNDPALKFYRILKLELKDAEYLDADHTFVFNIEKFKIDDL